MCSSYRKQTYKRKGDLASPVSVMINKGSGGEQMRQISGPIPSQMVQNPIEHISLPSLVQPVSSCSTTQSKQITGATIFEAEADAETLFSGLSGSHEHGIVWLKK
jgi:hypothetical protein